MTIKTVNPYKTHWYQRKLPYLFRKDRDRAAGFRETPEVVRFDVEKGVKASKKPPVRIYLGTEPNQHRAERVFCWSVKAVRDPARVYEIYLMSDLTGFDRTGWKTGFTNYRYAIPALAGGRGRAIYNDVDQIYLSDPAELFDMKMDGGGIMGITEKETSVMLIDCKKMIKYWPIEDVRNPEHKHAWFGEVVRRNDQWRQMPGPWNSRDGEHEREDVKCYHFTTLHTQPWEPFPDQLRYQSHPQGKIWFDLEHRADAENFQTPR